MAAAYHRALFLCLLAVSGCSALHFSPDNADLKQSGQLSVLAGQSQEKDPFNLEILEEINDGSRLHVVATLQVRTDWQAADLIARLVGLNQGQLVVVAYYPFDKKKGIDPQEAASELLREGSELRFTMSIPSGEISDYQLELCWGAEAREHLDKLAKLEERLPRLTIRKIELLNERGDCETPPCPTQLTVSGELFNSGETAVCDIELAVGLVWLATDEVYNEKSYDPAKAGEEQVRLTDLCLNAGVAKPIRFVIDREVPEMSGGRFRPVIRIVSFHSL